MAMAVVAFAGAGIASGAASDFDEVKAGSLQYVLARGAQ
jgi:hypothetical protein